MTTDPNAEPAAPVEAAAQAEPPAEAKPERPRLPFNQLFTQTATANLANLLQEVPELQGALTIPVWGYRGPEIPKAAVLTRSNNLGLADLLMITQQLADAQGSIATALLSQLQQFDAAAQQLAERIRDNQLELDRLDTILAQRRQEVGEAAASPANAG